MKRLIPTFFALSVIILTAPFVSFAKERQFTPSDVYQQVVNINSEVHLIAEYYKMKTEPNISNLRINIKPRNVWQASYIILQKINTLRSKHGLPTGTVIGLYPVLNLNPNLVYEQTQRILTELRIFKLRMGITGKIKEAPSYSGKKPIDVFNLFLNISGDLDNINNEEFSPSEVFAEVMRLYQDVSSILRYLQINDRTIPPPKRKHVQPKDAFASAMQMMQAIQRLQRAAGIERIDFSPLKKEITHPGDVYLLVNMSIAELKTLKAFLGMKKSRTHAAEFYEGKTPADVQQLIRWTTLRINQIHSLKILQ